MRSPETNLTKYVLGSQNKSQNLLKNIEIDVKVSKRDVIFMNGKTHSDEDAISPPNEFLNSMRLQSKSHHDIFEI